MSQTRMKQMAPADSDQKTVVDYPHRRAQAAMAAQAAAHQQRSPHAPQLRPTLPQQPHSQGAQIHTLPGAQHPQAQPASQNRPRQMRQAAMPTAHAQPHIHGHAYAQPASAPNTQARHGYRQPQVTQHHSTQPNTQSHPQTHPAIQPPKQQNAEPQERGLTAILLAGVVSLSMLAGVSIAGLYLLNGDRGLLSVADRKSNPQGLDLQLPMASPRGLQERAQKISQLEALNHSMMLEISQLRQKNRDMTKALTELKSLYSQARIGNSWALTEQDLKQAEPMNVAALSVDPSLYLSVPVDTGVLVSSNDLSEMQERIDPDLAFRKAEESQNSSEKLLISAPVPEQPVDTKIVTRETAQVEAKPEAAPKIQVAALAPVEPIAVTTEGEQGSLLARLPMARPKELAVSDTKVAALTPSVGFEPEPAPQATGPLSGNTGRFLAKMRALKAGSLNEPITILHVGDSHIASDSFTRGIRRRLQAIYGDAGRGAVIPAKAYKWAHADGLSLSAGRGWSSANSLKVKSGPYGISGVRVSSSSKGAKMTLTSKQGSFDWATVTLYVGPKQGNAIIRTDGGSKTVSARAAKPDSKLVRIEGRSKTLTVTHNGGGKTTVLNWASGKNKPGIQYVNFGIAGATVAITKRWSDGLLANDVKRINPDLIIYGYGTNEGYNDNLNMTSYRKMASGLVNKMQGAAPNAAMMFIGPADGARRRGSKLSCGGGWYTPNKLPAVRDTLKSMAKDYSGLFWDWATAMGGRCGVTRWAGQGLAAKDRVHLSQKGYDRSAAAFVDYLERTVKNSLKIASN